MKYLYLLLISLPLLTACTPTDLGMTSGLLKSSESVEPAAEVEAVRGNAASEQDGDLGDILLAELKAPEPAREVLRTGRKLALEEKTIIRGSCWNWINTVFQRAGYAKERHIVFKGKKRGPYARPEQIRPGDWLYYINHSYNGIEHSGIFVHWIDFDKKIGMVLSYGGEGRRKPGRYQAYDLKDVYFIKRPGDAKVDTRIALVR